LYEANRRAKPMVSLDVGGRLPAILRLGLQSPPREPDQPVLADLVGLPEFLVADSGQPLPRQQGLHLIGPPDPQMPFQQLVHGRRDPARHVHAVRHVSDRNLLLAAHAP